MSEAFLTSPHGQEKETSTSFEYDDSKKQRSPNDNGTERFTYVGKFVVRQTRLGDRVTFYYNKDSSGNDSDGPIIVQPPPDK
jgi:hypothetical protein